MLHRHTPDGLLLITQPAHAWISGQLARAWGNEQFPAFAPYEDVCLAAEQHDLAWLDWEQAPALNPATRLPYTFMDLPVPAHTALWQTAGPRALLQGSRYAALLISLHGSGLYQRREIEKDPPADRAAIQNALAVMNAFEGQQLETLRRDPFYAPYATVERIDENRALIACFDYLSLLLCMGVQKERLAELSFPRGKIAFTLSPVNGDINAIRLKPWPFSARELTVCCDVRRLNGTFVTQEHLDLALQDASREALRIRLSAG
ncbi:MAG TPA: DUF3891 family protein [Planctomycetota bacterium]|nr:DUF3891 family protein [Planctomycetota bacterium]